LNSINAQNDVLLFTDTTQQRNLHQPTRRSMWTFGDWIASPADLNNFDSNRSFPWAVHRLSRLPECRMDFDTRTRRRLA
jgi:hypothetical protein